MLYNDVELDSPPTFEIGEKVRIKKLIRNDGTFPGKEIGETLVRKEKLAMWLILELSFKVLISIPSTFSIQGISSAVVKKN